MSSLLGTLNPAVLELPLRGRHFFRLAFVDAAGAPVDLTDLDVTVRLFDREDDSLGDALLELTEGSGVTIVVPATGGAVVCDISDGQLATSGPDGEPLNANRLYPFVAIADGAEVATISGFLLPVWFVGTSEAVEPSTGMPLTSRYVNTIELLGYVGGDDYLDGIATVNQNLGTWVKFVLASDPPEEWELVVWTDSSMNTSAGVYQQPLDFNASTNAKVWVRRT